MGSFKHFEKKRRRQPGKIGSPLENKLQAVKWGEYRLGDLFEIFTNPQLDSENFNFSENGEYPYFTRTVFNNGFLGNVDYYDEAHKIKGNCLSVGLMAMQFFYMEKDFYAGQFTKRAVPKDFELTSRTAQFFLSLINQKKKEFLNVSVKNFKNYFENSKILLPQTADGKVDFDFMEAFIRELEEERIRELTAYLAATDLKDYSLTPEEETALKAFERAQWGEFRIGDLYGKVELKNFDFNKRNDTLIEKTEKYSLPLVNAKHGNNGIMFYGDGEIFDSEEMTIDIVQNGAVSTGDVYPQPQKTGVLWDAYLIKALSRNDTRESLFFFSGTIQKSIKNKFCYELKATWDRVKTEYIQLPIKNNEPDYSFMELFIKAVEKLVIKDVVLYADKKIDATRQVAGNH